MRLFRTVLRVFASRIFSALLGIVGLVVFTRVLGAEQFGVFILFQALIRMLSVVTDFGIHGAIEKRISEGVDESILGTGLALTIGLLVVTNVAILAIREPINAYLGAQLASFLVVALTLEQLGKAFMRTLTGELKIGQAQEAMLVRQFAFYALGIILVLFGLDIEGIVASLVASWFGFCGWAYYSISTPIRRPSIAAARSLVSYSKHNFLASVVGSQAYSWLDTLVIGLFLTGSAVTAYEIAWRITGLIMLLSRSIARTIFPQISQWDAEGDWDSIERVIPNAIAGGLLLVIPAIVGAAIFGERILRFVFGPEVAVAALPLFILMVGKIPEAVNVVLGPVLLGMNRPDLAARAVGAFIAVNVALNFVLVQLFGLTGAAVATVVAFTINASLVAYYLSKFLTIRLDYRLVGVSVLAALVMGAVLVSVQYVVPVETLPALVAMIGIGVICYGSALLLSPSIRDQMIRAVKSV